MLYYMPVLQTNMSCILRSIFQYFLEKKKKEKKKDVTFCETTATAHSYIRQVVKFSEIKVSVDV